MKIIKLTTLLSVFLAASFSLIAEDKKNHHDEKELKYRAAEEKIWRAVKDGKVSEEIAKKRLDGIKKQIWNDEGKKQSPSEQKHEKRQHDKEWKRNINRGPRGPMNQNMQKGFRGPRGPMNQNMQKGFRGPRGPMNQNMQKGFRGPRGPMNQNMQKGFRGPRGPIGSNKKKFKEPQGFKNSKVRETKKNKFKRTNNRGEKKRERSRKKK